jgi:hypothetical protein
MSEQESIIELAFRRKYNLGNWNDKEYTIKITGSDSQISKQLADERQKLTNYISQLESIVDIANDANKLKARLEVNTPTKMTEL